VVPAKIIAYSYRFYFSIRWKKFSLELENIFFQSKEHDFYALRTSFPDALKAKKYT